MTCPKCNSPEAVSKADAWDALTQTPPVVANRLSVLEPMAENARNVALYCGKFAPKEAVCVPVPVEYIDALRAHFGMDKYMREVNK